MDKNTRIIAIVVVIIVIVFAIWWCTNKRENYSNIGAVDNVGSLDTMYEMIPAQEERAPVEHFADMVDTGDQTQIIKPSRESLDSINPMERLHRVETRDLLPRTAASVTPYNIDVADPTSWAFSVNAPRVQLKNRLWNQADPLRGDIAITYHPNVPLIGKSSNNRDSQRLDGFFSDHYAALYNKTTGKGYKNMPMKVSLGGTIMDS
jgi:hypothetical protein